MSHWVFSNPHARSATTRKGVRRTQWLWAIVTATALLIGVCAIATARVQDIGHPDAAIEDAKLVPPLFIAQGDADQSVSVAHARRFDQLLRERGHDSKLTIVPGAGHEDPAFMATQMEPTFHLLDGIFGLARAGVRGQPQR